MSTEKCKCCEHRCMCCSKRHDMYNCFCTSNHDVFELAGHINFCPQDGSSIKSSNGTTTRPVVIISGTGATEREEMKKALTRYFKIKTILNNTCDEITCVETTDAQF